MEYKFRTDLTMGMPSGMNRMDYFPLDMSSVWYNEDEMKAYAKDSAIAYVGQILSLVDETNSKVTVYKIEDTNGTLKEVGIIPAGDQKTISVSSSGVISLLGASEAKNDTVPVIEDGSIVWKTLEDIGAGDGNDNTTYTIEAVKNSDNEIYGIKITPYENGEALSPVTIEFTVYTKKEIDSKFKDINDIIGTEPDEESNGTGLKGRIYQNYTIASQTASDLSLIIGSDTSKTIRQIAQDEASKIEIPVVPEYTITKDENSGDYAAVYHLTKGGVNEGVAINIPKDMMVQSGTVETLEAGVAGEGKPAGTYIVLTLANSTNDKIYIPADSLIEYVTGEETDTIIVSVDETTHKVIATIKDGSVTAQLLGPNVTSAISKGVSGADMAVVLVGEDTDKSVREIAREAITEDNNIATAEKVGTVKSVAETVENGVAVAADGTLSVNSLNVNKLVQTANTYLIINCGTASGTTE